jgi:hypothetical protein
VEEEEREEATEETEDAEDWGVLHVHSCSRHFPFVQLIVVVHCWLCVALAQQTGGSMQPFSSGPSCGMRIPPAQAGGVGGGQAVHVQDWSTQRPFVQIIVVVHCWLCVAFAQQMGGRGQPRSSALSCGMRMPLGQRGAEKAGQGIHVHVPGSQVSVGQGGTKH